jgi:hypothetical protein
MPLPRLSSWNLPTISLGAILLTGLPTSAAEPAPAPKLPDIVEFNRDIRPMLSDRCFACHGPDKNKREAELRLDTREGLLASRGSWDCRSGASLMSELWRRVTSDNPDERMPLRNSARNFRTRTRSAPSLD